MPDAAQQAKQTNTPKKRRGALREKFALAFLGVSVIPLLAMAVVAVYLVNISSRSNISQLELQLVRQKKEEVEKFFEEIRGVFDLRVPRVIYDMSVIPHDQRVSILQDTLADYRAIESVSIFSLEGQELDRIDRVGGLVSQRDLIDASHLEKFVQAKSGKSYLSDIRYTLEGSRIVVASPVRNPSGDIIGVLSGDLNLRSLERAVAQGVLGDAGYIMLLTENGELVTASLKDASAHPNLAHIEMVSSVASGMVRTGLEDADRYKSFWAEPVVGAGMRLSSLPFTIVAEWPEEDAFKLTRTLSRQALAFSLATLLAVFLLSMLIAYRITRPIALLRREAKIIGEGKFDEIIEIKTGDELEDLDNALHEMAHAIKTIQQLRDEFVFIAAHELRTPVTAIKGYISMLLENADALPKEAVDMLSQVQRANQHLVQLVQDLLEVARTEAGRMKVEVAPQNIVEAARTVVQDLAPLWQERKLAVEHRMPPDGFPPVLADQDKLREVLMNLLSNAIKYNRDSGTITITHELRGREVCTHIADAGIGMTPEEVSKLFEKFYRAENAETRRVQGTGLGLFIVKQILEKMGGNITVASERGKGSTFSFSLPIA